MQNDKFLSCLNELASYHSREHLMSPCTFISLKGRLSGQVKVLTVKIKACPFITQTNAFQSVVCTLKVLPHYL